MKQRLILLHYEEKTERKNAGTKVVGPLAISGPGRLHLLDSHAKLAPATKLGTSVGLH